MKFYVGSNHPDWLWASELRHPIFISNRALLRYKKFKPSVNPWALDSGGFTELKMNGGWTTTPQEYLGRIKIYEEELGKLEWASPQDWMCEPFMLEKTKKTIEQHQELTVNNYIDLSNGEVKTKIVPVLQGWTYSDYMNHLEMYQKRGIDLTSEKLVGLGSVCRRASLKEIRLLISDLYDIGIKLHCYGVKKDGVPLFGEIIESADSLAWSYDARWSKKNLCGTEHPSTHCTQCRIWACKWADKIVSNIGLLKP
jgi:hypothetical protein